MPDRRRPTRFSGQALSRRGRGMTTITRTGIPLRSTGSQIATTAILRTVVVRLPGCRARGRPGRATNVRRSPSRRSTIAWHTRPRAVAGTMAK